MKRNILIFFVFFLFSVPVNVESGNSMPLSSEGGRITVMYPPDKSLMEFGPLGVSMKVQPGSTEKIVIAVNGKELREIIPDSEFECFSLPLEMGLNKVDITGFTGGASSTIQLSVYRRSDLEVTYSKPPSEYKKNLFHLASHPDCGQCHSLAPSEFDKKPINIAVFSAKTSEDKQKAAAVTSTCYSCHQAITSYAYVHGPVSVWSCLSCHDVDSMPVYAVKKPDTEVCFRCHTEQRNNWTMKKYIHGPVNMGKCAICHSPHASENPFNLFKPTWDLCVSCHADKKTGRHILVGYIHEGHPTHEVPDPLRVGKELSCASCHNSHASNFPKLWALNVESQFELCMKCHKDKLL
jgi:predicted CXXCH cytochrome family protein